MQRNGMAEEVRGSYRWIVQRIQGLSEGRTGERKEYDQENMSAYGAYEIATASDDAQVTIFASGSEVHIALDAAKALEANGHPTRVVSVPSMELFEQQNGEYQSALIGNTPVNIGVEAAIRMGWDRYIGTDGIFIGMDSYGASAPINDLYDHFGITSEAIVSAAEQKLHAKTDEE